eukprot:CAMPEP_0167771036 /NCGR_PEP_ID=MMETSP0111_2-20121227/48_1 /TAXON_ID=91324 /ORGANISM="Lotharella globosa, Strain CCCM811" /LENGTH=132 /DNA_ID=CAMNT_0007660331 /DNA_START=1372 /DNA_END=1770 /DNA_ORIENTATION=-
MRLENCSDRYCCIKRVSLDSVRRLKDFSGECKSFSSPTSFGESSGVLTLDQEYLDLLEASDFAGEYSRELLPGDIILRSAFLGTNFLAFADSLEARFGGLEGLPLEGVPGCFSPPSGPKRIPGRALTALGRR